MKHEELLMWIELMLGKPDRGHDDVDVLIARKVACPVCAARAGNPCSWAAPRAVVSWCAHPARRRIVTP